MGSLTTPASGAPSTQEEYEEGLEQEFNSSTLARSGEHNC